MCNLLLSWFDGKQFNSGIMFLLKIRKKIYTRIYFSLLLRSTTRKHLICLMYLSMTIADLTLKIGSIKKYWMTFDLWLLTFMTYIKKYWMTVKHLTSSLWPLFQGEGRAWYGGILLYSGGGDNVGLSRIYSVSTNCHHADR